MTDTLKTEILVAGTGPAGLIAALAFAGRGFRVVLAGPDAAVEDERTTALMMPAVRFLESLPGLSEVTNGAAALATLRIADATTRLIRSPLVSFSAQEIGEEAFGFNFVNRALVEKLKSAVRESSAIDWRPVLIERWHPKRDAVSALLGDGINVSAMLAVAADGLRSPARAAVGIRVIRKSYPQTAFVTTFGHSLDHALASTEFHTNTGPFTQVPLPGKRSSLVWAVTAKKADELMAMGAGELSDAIETGMQSMLGKVTVGAERQVYPLSSQVPSSFARHRVALVGEAAHVFPPIGAQGLNLGVRDVGDLLEEASRSPSDAGAKPVLDRYNRRRRPDIIARTGSVHLLNQSLLSDMLPAQLARRVGLTALGAFAPLRGFFMREGLEPGSGFRHLSSLVREQVRR